MLGGREMTKHDLFKELSEVKRPKKIPVKAWNRFIYDIQGQSLNVISQYESGFNDGLIKAINSLIERMDSNE